MCFVRQWMKKSLSSLPSVGSFLFWFMLLSAREKILGRSQTPLLLLVTEADLPTGAPQAEVDSGA